MNRHNFRGRQGFSHNSCGKIPCKKKRPHHKRREEYRPRKLKYPVARSRWLSLLFEDRFSIRASR